MLFAQRKEKLLKKQNRQALMLDNMINMDGFVAGRSLRDRKPVTYTFGKTIVVLSLHNCLHRYVSVTSSTKFESFPFNLLLFAFSFISWYSRFGVGEEVCACVKLTLCLDFIVQLFTYNLFLNLELQSSTSFLKVPVLGSLLEMIVVVNWASNILGQFCLWVPSHRKRKPKSFQ